MDESAALLNDTAKVNFTYTAQLPFLRRANEILENLMLSNGVSIQKQISAVVSVVSSTSNIDLSAKSGYPSDMLLPIRLWERDGGTTQQFDVMTEKEWEPEVQVGSSITYWTFRNNKIYTPGTTSTRDIKIDYWRQLSAVTAAGDNEEVSGSKTFLAAKTAEMCARYIGQNTDMADSLLQIEVVPAQALLEGIWVKNSQGNRSRRKRFQRPRSAYQR